MIAARAVFRTRGLSRRFGLKPVGFGQRPGQEEGAILSKLKARSRKVVFRLSDKIMPKRYEDANDQAPPGEV